MKTILTIGPHRFVMSSTAIANAIAEALREAPQVEIGTTRSGSVIYSEALEEQRIDTFRVHLVNDDQVINGEPPVPSPVVSALLDVSPKEARRTRRTLAASPVAKRSTLAGVGR